MAKEDLDAFNRAREGTRAYGAARARLIEYFASSWNGRAGPKTTGAANYYFQLIETTHRNCVRVIGLEGSTTPFIFFRYGETNFGSSVRSYLWARRTPPHGRGVIFGGAAHFSSPAPANVQDNIAARDHGRTFVTLKDLKAGRPG